ncbi:2590_t:CDS:2, partial [Funneliformis geosporum]
DDYQFLTLLVCNQYWKRLATEHYREEGNHYQLQHKANVEKRVIEFDTKIGQKWVDDLDHQNKRRRCEASTLEKYSDYNNVKSLVDDNVGDESENESENYNDYDETGNESNKRFYLCLNDIEVESESDYDTTDENLSLQWITKFTFFFDSLDDQCDFVFIAEFEEFESDSDELVESDHEADENKDNKDPLKIDKLAFRKVHHAIPDNAKMYLKSGKIVEDVLFKDMKHEYHAHSYIINYDDENVNELFTEMEWNELTEDRIRISAVLREIREELVIYGKKKTLSELYNSVLTSYLQDRTIYDINKHYNQEWIQMVIDTGHRIISEHARPNF